MNEQVGRVVALGFRSAQGIVERKREVQKRSPADGLARLVGRREDCTQIGKISNRRIVRDRGGVIEDERAAE